MAYVIYHKETTRFLRILRDGYWQDAIYETKAGATARLNKEVKAGRINAADCAIVDGPTFHRDIEKQEQKKNLLTGILFTQPVNTPPCCDPSMETYWSM